MIAAMPVMRPIKLLPLLAGWEAVGASPIIGDATTIAGLVKVHVHAKEICPAR